MTEWSGTGPSVVCSEVRQEKLLQRGLGLHLTLVAPLLAICISQPLPSIHRRTYRLFTCSTIWVCRLFEEKRRRCMNLCARVVDWNRVLSLKKTSYGEGTQRVKLYLGRQYDVGRHLAI